MSPKSLGLPVDFWKPAMFCQEIQNCFYLAVTKFDPQLNTMNPFNELLETKTMVLNLRLLHKFSDPCGLLCEEYSVEGYALFSYKYYWHLLSEKDMDFCCYCCYSQKAIFQKKQLSPTFKSKSWEGWKYDIFVRYGHRHQKKLGI